MLTELKSRRTRETTRRIFVSGVNGSLATAFTRSANDALWSSSPYPSRSVSRISGADSVKTLSPVIPTHSPEPILTVRRRPAKVAVVIRHSDGASSWGWSGYASPRGNCLCYKAGCLDLAVWIRRGGANEGVNEGRVRRVTHGLDAKRDRVLETSVDGR